LARANGAQVEMEMTLFFRACRGPIFGVTGTKGKTTTSTALHTLLRAAYPDAVLAGNMGRSALTQLDQISTHTPVVLELSSFQLESLDEQQLSPEVAVLTNIAEDHLDRYASLDEYAAVKAAIARHQDQQGWLIVNRDDALTTRAVCGQGTARRVTFGRDAVADDNALWIDGDALAGRWQGVDVNLGRQADLRLIGRHGQLNVLAAAGAALAGGVPPEMIAGSLASIDPVPDRLEPVAELDGVRYINDTTATVPAAAIAALQAFEGQRLIVIAGGSDKRVSLRPFAEELARRAAHVILLAGAGTTRLQAELAALDYARTIGPLDSMDAAIQQAAGLAGPGDVVLLSPGCASFGMFRNEFHRGAEFRAAVGRLTATQVGR
jgi:UDP-N-acetylmuramoylalanine--D-glutamate ligase